MIYVDLKTKDDHIAFDKGHNKYNKFHIDGVKTRLPDPLDERESSPSILHQVDSSRFKTARKFRKTMFGKLTLTRPIGLLIMMWTQLLQPTIVNSVGDNGCVSRYVLFLSAGERTLIE